MNSQQDKNRLLSGTPKTARSSVLCGIVMLAGWVIPLLGLPLGVAGLAMGFTSLSSPRRDLARAGLFLNSLGLGLTVLNILLAFYFMMTGKLDSLLMFYQ